MLDAAEVRVDVAPVGDLLDLREDVVEVFRSLEQAEPAGMHVGEIEDGEDAFRVLDQAQDLVQAPDDLGPAARLDPEAGADLRLLVGVPDRPEVLRDPVEGLLRVQLAEHAEVGDHHRRSHRLREHAAPDEDRKSTRLNSSHITISYAVFCLKKKKKK